MRFSQANKHSIKGRGLGNPCVFRSDEEAQRALEQSVEVKPGMRVVALTNGCIAVFRSASKLPDTVGADSWHGGWQACPIELATVGGTLVPTFDGR